MLFKVFPLILLTTVSSIQRPVIDFDLVIETLKPSGTWESIGGESYAFRPVSTSPQWRPLREGRWLYTDYGWTWEGRNPGSWATDHYGTWSKKNTAGWVWIPERQWLPASVEWLQSGTYLGWRPSKLDRFSNLLESETDRRSDPSEWNFVPLTKIKDALKPEDFADNATTETLLKNAVPVDHVYVAYREIPRPGPSQDLLKSESGEVSQPPVIRELQDSLRPPEKTGPGDFYVYRPTFHQDNDGLMRRVHLFLNPRAQKENESKIKETVGDRRSEAEKSKDMRKIEDALEQERKKMESLYR